MSRRRLRVVCSSDEDEEEPPSPPPPPPPPLPPQMQEVEEIDELILEDIEDDFQTVTLNSANPTPNSINSTTTTTTTIINRSGSRPSEPIPLDISDEEGEDINGVTPNNSNFGSVNDNTSYFEVSGSPVNGVLERMGLRLKREWLDSCLHGLQSSVPGFQGMDDSAKAKLCFAQFLCSDMNYSGAGVLPPNVHTLHSVDLKGPFVLQVDEIVNISCPLRGRYQNAAAGIKRCLKLSMTDGVQRVFGIEYRPVKDLEVLSPAGLKVAVCNVNIRHGLLMLVPGVLEVLGGTVEELEAARHRLVNEINKPPRGKRNRTGVVPPLATRATLAAWPRQNDAVPGHVDRNTRVNATSLQASGPGTAVSTSDNDRHRQAFATPFSGRNAEPDTSATPQPREHDEVPRHTHMPASTVSITANGMHRRSFAPPFSRKNTEPNMSAGPRPQEHDEVPSHTDLPASTPLWVSGQGTALDTPAHDRHNPELSTLSAVQLPEPVNIPQHIDEPMTEVMKASMAASQVSPPSISANGMPGEGVKVPISRDNPEPDASNAVKMDVEEISMVDELEHHFLLSRDKEIPFTYLASLSAKCMAIEEAALAVRGKIKCFLTGVKGFQYKQKATYELRVYVDDGSLISEILIDHNVVQRGIGYSPQEVTSALASSDSKRVSEMKETLKQFQIFLVNFEGTMLVEMNKAFPIPVAVEMNQGCAASDARLLLKRLKSFSSTQPRNTCHLNPIHLSA